MEFNWRTEVWGIRGDMINLLSLLLLCTFDIKFTFCSQRNFLDKNFIMFSGLLCLPRTLCSKMKFECISMHLHSIDMEREVSSRANCTGWTRVWLGSRTQGFRVTEGWKERVKQCLWWQFSGCYPSQQSSVLNQPPRIWPQSTFPALCLCSWIENCQEATLSTKIYPTCFSVYHPVLPA